MTRYISLKQKSGAYLGLIFVLFIWGAAPLITVYLHNFFSPTIRIAMGTFVCAVSMLLISIKFIKEINKEYLKLAIPTGACIGIADILQKIGLLHTTPSHYAFLENLSVVVVPILLFFIIKKKPSFFMILASLLCLLSCCILTGIFSGGGEIHLLGDTLCALSGVFYGINIAVTGVYAKKFFVPIYLTIQLFTQAILSFLSAIVLHATGIEPIMFTFEAKPIILNIIFVLITLTLGWLIRTYAMQSVDPTVVAVMMPFSATITVVASIILGQDTLSVELIIGAVLGIIAIILSALGDKEPKIKKE